MKKKSLLVILFMLVCLLTVGCGKDDEKEESSSKPKVSTLTCSQEEDGETLKITIEQDKKTYEFNKVDMSITAPIKSYSDYVKSSEELEKLVCTQEDETVKSCTVKEKEENYEVVIAYDAKAYSDQLVEDEEIKELNENALNELKESAEEDGATCTIE